MFWILQNLFIEFLIQVTKYHKEMVSFYDILNSNINKHYIHSDWIFFKTRHFIYSLHPCKDKEIREKKSYSNRRYSFSYFALF